MALALAAALLRGTAGLLRGVFHRGENLGGISGSPHVYTGVNPDCGKIYDRSGTLLLNTNDGRVYSDGRSGGRRFTCWATATAISARRCFRLMPLK